ncbi:epoxide hydrolase family protein [Gordonia paraffinivorans]|uniref:epoxide hydrolase family protein n=1 Tax=Gordonia paraffinivorans TaxID=175628 RepID=UPI001E2E3011|nr:epoxide hydrolase family protein [Gordonia paraffinivorans]MCD2146962.1 epoxide hydrolase [Gordonia paraffinivorans]
MSLDIDGATSDHVGGIEDWQWSPVEEAAIEDLVARLDRYRSPVLSAASGWERGTPTDYLESLVKYWARSFDWRVAERRICSYPWVRANINGEPVTAIHRRSRDPEAPVVVLLHGWPDSFLRFERVLPLLEDVHVVIPCLKGYPGAVIAGSEVATPAVMAEQVAGLLRALGYTRYVVSGGDVGSVVATHLAGNHGKSVSALHMTDLPAIKVPVAVRRELTERELIYYREARRWRATEGAYRAEQATKPHTLARSLSDSPVGLAAWIIEKLHGWSDCRGDIESVFSRDDLLTWVSLYWHTGAIGTSFDPYSAPPLNVDHVETPTAVSMFRHGLLPPGRELFRRFYNVQSWNEHADGGHFAAWERPVEFVEGLRSALTLA